MQRLLESSFRRCRVDLASEAIKAKSANSRSSTVAVLAAQTQLLLPTASRGLWQFEHALRFVPSAYGLTTMLHCYNSVSALTIFGRTCFILATSRCTFLFRARLSTEKEKVMTVSRFGRVFARVASGCCDGRMRMCSLFILASLCCHFGIFRLLSISSHFTQIQSDALCYFLFYALFSGERNSIVVQFEIFRIIPILFRKTSSPLNVVLKRNDRCVAEGSIVFILVLIPNCRSLLLACCGRSRLHLAAYNFTQYYAVRVPSSTCLV